MERLALEMYAYLWRSGDGRQDLGVDVVHRCFPEGCNSIFISILLRVLASEAERFVYLLAMP